MKFHLEGDDLTWLDVVGDLAGAIAVGFSFTVEEYGILRAFLRAAKAHQDGHEAFAGFVGILGVHKFVIAAID